MELYTRQGTSCSILAILQQHWLNTEEDGAVGNEASEERAHMGVGRWREHTGIPGTWQLMVSASEHLFLSLHASHWNWSCIMLPESYPGFQRDSWESATLMGEGPKMRCSRRNGGDGYDLFLVSPAAGSLGKPQGPPFVPTSNFLNNGHFTSINFMWCIRLSA